MRRAVWMVARSEFADTVETGRRSDPVLAETLIDDEEQSRKPDNQQAARELGIEVYSYAEDVER